MTRLRVVTAPAVVGLAAVILAGSAPAQQPADAVAALRAGSFIENRGQWSEHVRYAAFRPEMIARFETDAIVLQRNHRDGNRQRTHVLRLAFEGSRGVQPRGAKRRSGHHNYMLGAAPATWRTRVPSYEQLLYGDVAPGVDVRVREHDGNLEYDVLLAPGARLGDAVIRCDGAEGLRVADDGSLVISTAAGELVQPAPTTWQIAPNGDHHIVACRYRVLRDDAFGFAVDAWDGSSPLVIDPSLIWSTFVGGKGYDYANAVAVDTKGATYVTGYTASSDFPKKAGSFDTTYNGAIDAFVAKLSPDGKTLEYVTYLGGTAKDEGHAIAVGANGQATALGFTTSNDYPTTAGALQAKNQGGFGEMFVTRLDANGARAVYSTYLGGKDYEWASDVAVDPAGNATVAGWSKSTDYPTTAGAYDRTYKDKGDAVVTRIDPTGGKLVWSTFVGSAGWDEAASVAVDRAGNAIVSGTVWADSNGGTNYPTTAGAYDRTYNGGRSDVFVTSIAAKGGSLVYSTLIGGKSTDYGRAIAVGPGGDVHVGGLTWSSDWPVTKGAFDTTWEKAGDNYLSHLDAKGAKLMASTFLGGNDSDDVAGVGVHPTGDPVVIGWTKSTNFPVTPNAAQGKNGGGRADAFVTRVDCSYSKLSYSTYIGGSSYDGVYDAVLGPAGNATLVGEVWSANFPATTGAYDTTYNGGGDAFATRAALTPVGVTPYGASTPACRGAITLQTNLPVRGNSKFAFWTAGAPANAVGVLVVGTRQSKPGVRVINMNLHVPLMAPYVVRPVKSDMFGRSRYDAPLPGYTGGGRFFAQTVWVNTPGCRGSGPLSASRALDVLVQ